MALYEKRLNGNFNELLSALDSEILEGSASASYEGGSDCMMEDVRCAVRVYERYSAFGGNRVSLSITLMGRGEDLFLSAITSGGSQALFCKINTIGESNFLDKVIEFIEDYTQTKQS